MNKQTIERTNERTNERMNKRASSALKHEHKTDKPCSPVYFNLKQFSILIPRETGLMYVIFKLILIFRFALQRFRISTFYWMDLCECEHASVSAGVQMCLSRCSLCVFVASLYQHNTPFAREDDSIVLRIKVAGQEQEH